jgi:hypothetical protein
MGVLPATTALVDGPLLPSGGQGVKVLDLEGAAHHVEDLYPDAAVLASKSRLTRYRCCCRYPCLGEQGEVIPILILDSIRSSSCFAAHIIIILIL